MSGDGCQIRGTGRAAIARRRLGPVRWLFPATILALTPKCPACVAAYVALVTGIGVSVSTASYMRICLVILCVGSLGYLAVRRVGGFLGRKRTLQQH